MLSRLACSLLCVLLAGSTIGGAAAAGEAWDWTQWRGPDRDGQVPALPGSLADLKADFQLSLEPSYSGPVADADRIYTTMTENKEREVVLAIDRATGKEAWRASWDGAMKVPFFAASNGSWIRATLALHDGRLYVAGMKDVLVCLDAGTGEIVWKKDFVAAVGTSVPMFGNVCSPLVIDGPQPLVVVQSADSVIALDAGTGEQVWRSLAAGEGGEDGAFSSPALATDAPGGPQLLVQTRSDLAGLNPQTGDVIWQTPVEAYRGMNILTPTYRVAGDTLEVFTSSYGGGSTLYAVTGKSVSTKWTNKSEAYMASPVLVGDRLVVPLRNQRTAAIDWNTGETIWTSTPYGKYWSMVTDGEQVLALDQRGSLYRLDVSGEKLAVLESREISPTETWGYLAWDGRQLMIRRLDGLDVYSVE